MILNIVNINYNLDVFYIVNNLLILYVTINFRNTFILLLNIEIINEF